MKTKLTAALVLLSIANFQLSIALAQGNASPSGVVKSVNGLAGNVSISAGAGITITPVGNGISISADAVGPLNAWNITGNAGTDATTHFLGTIDDQPLELRANGQRGLRIEPTFNDHPNFIGGAGNSVAPSITGATIGGGYLNFAGAGAGTIAGGEGNSTGLGADYASIGGGSANQIQYQAFAGSIGGGYLNVIQDSAFLSTISGGERNTIATNADTATISGGGFNTIAGGTDGAAIGGGWSNTIEPNADYATVAGGVGNIVGTNAEYAIVGGGGGNTANGSFATVPGGDRNLATNYAFAAGRRAKANHTGSFVWGDSSSADVTSSANDQFTVRVAGGVRFFSDSTLSAGVSLAPGGTSWGVLSDRNVKKDFASVDSRAILEKLAVIPITQWHYKWEEENVTPHIGPMAQDFKAAFYPGRDGKGITTLEADGVALAAIQGLNEKVEEKEARIRELEKTVGELKELVGRLASGKN